MLRVGVVQCTSGPDLERNLANATQLVEQAVNQGAKFVLFPENFALMCPNRNDTFAKAQDLKGPVARWLAGESKRHGIWILAGSLPLKPRNKGSRKLTNTSLLFNAKGRLAARYDKIHLFDVLVKGDRAYEESKTFAPGKTMELVRTPWGRLGLTICYDIRFPELYRKLSSAGAEMIAIPAAFAQKTGEVHWDVLTRARAIENLAYVLAPAICGSPYEGRRCYGHARIVDPWGHVIAERPDADGPGVVMADLDFDRVHAILKDFPTLEHRKIHITKVKANQERSK
jgi:nitrilase